MQAFVRKLPTAAVAAIVTLAAGAARAAEVVRLGVENGPHAAVDVRTLVASKWPGVVVPGF